MRINETDPEKIQTRVRFETSKVVFPGEWRANSPVVPAWEFVIPQSSGFCFVVLGNEAARRSDILSPPSWFEFTRFPILDSQNAREHEADRSAGHSLFRRVIVCGGQAGSFSAQSPAGQRLFARLGGEDGFTLVTMRRR